MIERAVTFGPGGCLLGVLCEPDAGKAREGAPAMIVWNVGINHHVGPFRFYVELARKLAHAGFTTLRFDASGLGDSGVRREAASDKERTALDLRDAMALLEARTQARRFVLTGFCSSVDPAHAMAMQEPRVAGVVYIEGYTYPTRGTRLRYPLRLLSAIRWRRYLQRRFGNKGAVRATSEREQIFIRDIPTREGFSKDLHALAARSVRTLFLYVGGDSGYSHRDQAFEMFGEDLRGKLDVEFFPEADHTFFRTGDRTRALDRIAAWMRAAF